ncbi:MULTISPECIES: NgoMIV family type II restriction endonuclease [unclassified Mycobacterium]|uniref:NgoMIV family type II restriction endonuclease n=1 Tax=unclassified Mycobacterium TaxID=2642494 RepID=UPI0012E36746|nr:MULTISPECIES: NgoMIV family type II restriction endonuclease [unclassified Mycobacterium]
MPASFAADLCGYRLDRSGNLTANPNTSDAHDTQSVELGRALFAQLGVASDSVAPTDPGTLLEVQLVNFLRDLRPDLHIDKSRAAKGFSQYAHLDVFPNFRRNFGDLRPALEDLATRVRAVDLGVHRAGIERDLEALAASTDTQAALVEDLGEQMPEESLLRIDISVAIPHEGQLDELAIAISSKWSLRTDRVQDPVSQGNKLVAQRRGMMPHFGVLTIEPRPAMLKILADGSGAVDYVYHLDLPALERTIEAVAQNKPANWSPKRTFRRLMTQHRLRDFDQLIYEVMRVPNA